MEELKEHWIREVEEVVTADMKSLSKDDEETDQPEVGTANANSPRTNDASFVGSGAFNNNSSSSTESAVHRVSFDFIQLDNSHSNNVDTTDLVNFNTPPFAGALEMPFPGYDVMSQATGMSEFTAQQLGDVNMYQPSFDENNFAQHLVSQESAQYLNVNNQMWS